MSEKLSTEETVAMTLKQWREMIGITQRQFAMITGISQAYVYEIEHGKSCSPELRERTLLITLGKVELEAGPGSGHRGDHSKRFERILAARKNGVSYKDIAERFGYASAKSAQSVCKYIERRVHEPY